MEKTIQQFAFDPPEGLESKVYSPTYPESESAIRSQIQGMPNQLRDKLNTIIDTLSSSAVGAGGADHIGNAPLDGIASARVGDQLRGLQGQIQGMTHGLIPAKSITKDKLADGACAYMYHREFSASGTFTAPINATYHITCIGGGGSGVGTFTAGVAGATSGNRAYTYGNGGGYSGECETCDIYMFKGEQFPFVIGKGGALKIHTNASATPQFGNDGSETSFGIRGKKQYISAIGGSGGCITTRQEDLKTRVGKRNGGNGPFPWTYLTGTNYITGCGGAGIIDNGLPSTKNAPSSEAVAGGGRGAYKDELDNYIAATAGSLPGCGGGGGLSLESFSTADEINASYGAPGADGLVIIEW